MTDSLPNPSTTSLESIPGSAVDRRVVTLVAVQATLLLSKLPLVIARQLLGVDIPWIVPAWIGIALLLSAATYLWQALKPLRGYFAIMAAILLMAFVIDPFVRQSTVWNRMLAGRSQMVVLSAERALIAVEALIVLGLLLLAGLSRREIYLKSGDLRAPARAIRLPGRGKPVSWSVFGPVMALLLGVLFFTFLASQNPLPAPSLAAVIPWRCSRQPLGRDRRCG